MKYSPQALSIMRHQAEYIAAHSCAAYWSEKSRVFLSREITCSLESLAEAAGFRLVPVKDTTSEEPE